MEKLDIFISSPRDVRQERRIAEQVVRRLNSSPYISEKFVLNPLLYEEEVPAEVGESPQLTVDRYMRADQCSIVICILWQRMGTPVTDPNTQERFQSGTEYEFIHAYRSNQKTGWPRILLYRMMKRIQPDADLDQLSLVQSFFARFMGDAPDFKGLPKPVRSAREFERVLSHDLDSILFQYGREKNEHTVSRKDFYRHIPLPVNYVRREQLLAELSNRVLGSSPDRPIAIHASAGAGKSTVARALCDDPEIYRTFSDGILFIELGQNPNVSQKLNVLLQALGGTVAENAPSEEMLKAACATLLAERHCLLVLDNVWSAADAETFRFNAPHCRLLLTTRDDAMARAFGALTYSIPDMTLIEAVELLNEWSAPRVIEQGFSEQIVKRLGRLPLALKLAGVELQKQEPAAWLAASHGQTPASNIARSVSLNLDSLEPRLSRLYVVLGIFKKTEPIPVSAIEHLWKGLEGLNSEATADLLEELDSRALLELQESAGLQVVRLHDLLYDRISTELSNEGQVEAHRVLLSAYRSRCRDHGWDSAEDDGYLFDHLAYHLTGVGSHEEIKMLFDDPGWMNVRVPQSGYRYTGFLEDLEHAWAYAEAHCEDNDLAVTDCIRFALIRSSINSVAANYLPAIVGRALETGYWKTDRSLAIAARIADDRLRAGMYLAILESGRLGPEDREMACDLAVSAIERTHSSSRAELLNALVSLTDVSWLPRLLDVALAADSVYRADCIKVLAPLLNEELVQRALDAAQPVSEDWYRAHLFVALALKLSTDHVVQVANLAFEMEPENLRVEVLEELMPRILSLDLDQQATITERCLNKVVEMGLYKAETLALLAPVLRGAELLRAIELALALESSIGDALKALAPQILSLDADQQVTIVERCLNKAVELDPWIRTKVLIALAPVLQDWELLRAIELAFTVGDSIGDALGSLAMRMDQQLIAQTVLRLLAWQNENQRAQGLSALAPFLTGRPLDYTFQAAFQLKKGEERITLMEAVAPRVTDAQRLQILDEVLGTSLRLVIELLPYLAEDHKSRALEYAIGNWRWAKAKSSALYLEKIVIHLPTARKREVLKAALETIFESWIYYDSETLNIVLRETGDEFLARAVDLALALSQDYGGDSILLDVTRQVAHRIDEHIQRRVLTAILPPRGVQDYSALINQALKELAPHLTSDLLEYAITWALALPEGWRRSEVFTILAPRLSGGLLEQVLTSALKISDWEAQAAALAHLSQYGAPDAQSRALRYAVQSALKVPDVLDAERAISRLGPYLTKEWIPQALEGALSLPVLVTTHSVVTFCPRARSVQGLVTGLTEPLLDRVFKEALHYVEAAGNLSQLPSSAARERQELLESRARLLAKIASELKPVQRQTAVAQALQDTIQLHVAEDWDPGCCRALEDLAPSLKGETLQQALGTAAELSLPWKKYALAALVSQVSTDQQVKIWTTILDANDAEADQDFRAHWLSHYAPHIHETLLDRLLRASLALPKEKYASRVLEAVAPRLDGSLLQRALDAAQSFADPACRGQALVALVPRHDGASRERVLQEALEAALTVQEPEAKAWLLPKLILQLQGGDRERALEEGLAACANIDNPDRRLSALGQYLPPVSEESSIVRRIRIAMAEELRIRGEGERERVLRFCSWEDLVRPPMLSAKALSDCINSIISYCYEWNWM